MTRPPRYAPEYVTPEALARLDRTRERLLRLDRGLPPEAPCACPDPPRRRRVVDHGTTPEQREAFVREALAPPVSAETRPAVRRVTLADVKRLPQPPPWLRRLTASGHRPHPVDPYRRPTWNGGETYHDLVARGGRL